MTNRLPGSIHLPLSSKNFEGEFSHKIVKPMLSAEISKSLEIFNAQKKFLAENLHQLESQKQDLENQMQLLRSAMGDTAIPQSMPVDVPQEVVLKDSSTELSGICGAVSFRTSRIVGDDVPPSLVLDPSRASRETSSSNCSWKELARKVYNGMPSYQLETEFGISKCKLPSDPLKEKYQILAETAGSSTLQYCRIEEILSTELAGVYSNYNITYNLCNQICECEISMNDYRKILIAIAKIDLISYIEKHLLWMGEPFAKYLQPGDEADLSDFILEYGARRGNRPPSRFKKKCFAIHELCSMSLPPSIYGHYSNNINNSNPSQPFFGYRQCSYLALFCKQLVREQFDYLVEKKRFTGYIKNKIYQYYSYQRNMNAVRPYGHLALPSLHT